MFRFDPPPGHGSPRARSSAQEMLTWKREYNIRRREAQWQRRQEDALLEKQVGWELARLDRENRLEVTASHGLNCILAKFLQKHRQH